MKMWWLWWLWPGGVSNAKCAKSTPSLWGGLTILDVPGVIGMDIMVSHGEKCQAIKGHRTSGLVVDEEVAWTCTMSCKRARKRVCVHSIFHSQAAETWWTWHQQTSEKNSTSSSTSVLGLRCYHNYSCCPSYTKANHRPHLFLHRARQEPSKPNAQRDSTFGSTFSMPMPKSAGFHSQGWLLPWVKCKSC